MDKGVKIKKIDLCTRYFILKYQFLSSSKKILHLKESNFSIHSIPHYHLYKETYSYTEIQSIKLYEKNDRDFTIIMKKGDQLSLSCNNRSSLVSEIYSKINKMQTINEYEYQLNTIKSFEISKLLTPNSLKIIYDINLWIYQSYIEIEHINLRYDEDSISGSGSSSSGNTLCSFIKIPESVSIEHTNKLVLLYNKIKSIEKTDYGFMIETKDKCSFHHLIINDIGKLDKMIRLITDSSKVNTGHEIKVIEFDKIEAEQRKKNSASSLKGFNIEVPVYKILPTLHLAPIVFCISDGYIVEIDPSNNLINSQIPLLNLIDIVRCNNGCASVQLIFSDSTEVIYLPPPNYRDIFISNIISLLKMRKPPHTNHLVLYEFIHSQKPLYHTRIQGWPNGEIDPEYEIDLIKNFCSPRDDETFYQTLREFVLNAYLTNFNDYEPKPLQFLLQLFMKHATIMLTEQFIGFAEAYEESLRYAFNIDFSHCLQGQRHAYKELKLSENDYTELIQDIEDDMASYTTKFQFEGAEKEVFKELNKLTYPKYLLRVEEILKVLIILISSKSLYREICTNKKDFGFYENALVIITKMIDYPIPIISQLAGSFLYAFIKNANLNDKRLESLNKHILITSKINLMKTIRAILIKRVLIKAPTEFLQENPNIIQILSCLRLLKALLYNRKDTTNPDDMMIVYKYIEQPCFFAIFNFLSRYKTLPCIYKTTLLINCLLQNTLLSKDKFKEYQGLILNHSSLVGLHLLLVLSSNSKLQKQISIIFLSNIFLDNANACSLICRIIPKNMFRRVDFNSHDITKWNLAQWEEFFHILRQTYNTPNEQWSEECRQELIEKLYQLDQEVMDKFRYLTLSQANSLLDSPTSQLSEYLLNVRWNHEEIEFNYNCLKNKLLVWKYYLIPLLKDGEEPSLLVTINKPMIFWNELNTCFISSYDAFEMKIVVKIMILVYRQYYLLIGDLSNMAYWLKIINDRDYDSCKYLIMQLIYMSMVVNDKSISRCNIKKFVDSKGVHRLADVLSGLFAFEEYPLVIDRISSNKGINYNYTPLNLPKQGLNPQTEKMNMMFYIINIYKVALMRPKEINTSNFGDDRVIYPISNATCQIIEEQTINCLINILLMNDNNLTLELVRFFETYLCDKFTFKHLIYNKLFWEYLLMNMNEVTIESKLQLVRKIYFKIADELPLDNNFIKIYTEISFEPTPKRIADEAVELFPILKYFPKYMIWRLINYDFRDFSQIYFSECYETPLLIWNQQMKQLLEIKLQSNLHIYRNQLQKYSQEEHIYSRFTMPVMYRNSDIVIYANLLEEITCGPIFLRIWVRKTYKSLKTPEIPEDFIQKFIFGLDSLLNRALSIPLSEMSQKQLDDLLIIIKAHSKTIKIHELREYQCFEDVLILLNNFALLYSQLSPKDNIILYSEYLLDLSRLIYRAIRIQSINTQTFLLYGGLKMLLFTLGCINKKMDISKIMNPYNYYMDLTVSLMDLKILSVLLKTLTLIYQQSPREFTNLNPEIKIEFCLNLQNISKIGITLFEYIHKSYDMDIIPQDKQIYNMNINNQTTNFDSLEGHNNEQLEEDEFDPALVSIFDVLSSYKGVCTPHTDQYFQKIFYFNNKFLTLLLNLSKECQFTTSIVQSGLGWRCLEFLCYFDNLDTLAKCNDGNLSIINQQADKAGLIFRNLLIYCSEAFILKITTEGTKSVIIITSKERSPQLMVEINKIDKNQRDILVIYYESCLELFGKKMLQILLEDFCEPVALPDDKDKKAVFKFLKLISSTSMEPDLLWNHESRIDLKEILKFQILSINEIRAFKFNDQIEKLKYPSHKQELVINDIFVRSFNKNPTWKIPNAQQFLHDLLGEMKIVCNSLLEKPGKQDRKSILIFISNALQTLSECTKAVENIITHHELEIDIIDQDEYLNQLAILLYEDKFYGLPFDPACKNIKISILNIFIRLSMNVTGAIILVENVLFIKNIIKILRNSHKENHYLIEKALKILESIAQFDNLNQILVKYGIYILILENIIKTEVLSLNCRIDSLALLTKYLKKHSDMNDTLVHFILLFFPQAFQHIIVMDIDPSETINLIDTGYEMPSLYWTHLMRQEILMILYHESEAIQRNWQNFPEDEIKISETKFFWDLNINQRPIFPELDDMIIIANVNLKVFNSNPESSLDINCAVFIDEIAISLNTSYDDFISLMNEFENLESLAQSKLNTLDRLCCKITILMSSLMLSLDQLINNMKHDKFRFVCAEKSESQGEKEEIVDKKCNRKLVSEEALSFIIKALSFLNYKKIHRDIKCTLLQLIYLIADIERGMSLLKTNDIMHYICQFICEVDSELFDNMEFYNHIEEKLIFGVLLKLLIQDSKLVSEINKETLAKIKEYTTKNKVPLNDLLRFILMIIYQEEGNSIEMSEDDDENLKNIEAFPANPIDYLNTIFWRDCNSEGYHFICTNESLMSIIRLQHPDKQYKFPVISEFAIKYLPHPSEENMDYRAKIEDFINNLIEESNVSKEEDHPDHEHDHLRHQHDLLRNQFDYRDQYEHEAIYEANDI